MLENIINSEIIINIVVLLISIILHELAHGFVAYLNGDDTAKRYGRLTLNPIKHLDPLGTLLPIILLLSGSGFVIGWAKPVPVNYRSLKRGEFSIFQVSIAGVVVNFLLVFLGATIIKLFPSLYLGSYLVNTVITGLIQINIALGIFNLLPIPPLDGSKIVWSLGGDKIKEAIVSLEQYGFIIIIIASYLGLLGRIIEPVYRFIMRLLVYYIN